jgi:hypothetical protein
LFFLPISAPTSYPLGKLFQFLFFVKNIRALLVVITPADLEEDFWIKIKMDMEPRREKKEKQNKPMKIP